jgi:ribosomal protein S27E
MTTIPLLQFLCVPCAKLLEFQVPLAKFGVEIKCPHCGNVVKQVLFPVQFKVK